MRFLKLHILLSLFYCIQVKGQVVTDRFNFLQGTSEAVISAAYDRDAAQLFTLDMAGFVTTWDINNMYPIRKFYGVPHMLSEKTQTLMQYKKIIGYDKQRLWIIESSITQGEQIDAYDRITGKYLTVSAGEAKNFYDAYVPAYSPALKPQKLEDQDKGVAALGDYRVEYSSQTLRVLHNDKTVTRGELRVVTDFNLFAINKVFFISEDVLLICGTEPLQMGAPYSGGHMGQTSAIIKYNWKTGISTRNRAFDFEFSAFTNARLSVSGDTSILIRAGNANWVHQLQPGKLDNHFNGALVSGTIEGHLDLHGIKRNYEQFKLEAGQDWRLGWIEDMSARGNIYHALPVTNTKMVLVEHQSNGKLGKVFVYEHLKGYMPFKVHPDKKLLLWKSPEMNDRNYFLTDFDGKIIKKFTSTLLYEPNLIVTQDGNWFAYIDNYTDFQVFNILSPAKSFSISHGATGRVGRPTQLAFDRAGTKIAYTLFDPAQPQTFILAQTNLQTQKRDTLLKLQVVPDEWTVDGSLEHIAMAFSINFLDSTLRDKTQAEQATRYKFRNRFAPNILVYNFKTGNIEPPLLLSGGTPVKQLAFMGNRILTIQKDGMLHYYDRKEPNFRVKQWLYGSQQAFVSKDGYYATPQMIDLMLIQNDLSYVPVGAQDVFFNQPHKIIASMDTANKTGIKLYELTYNKRLRQSEVKLPAVTQTRPVLTVAAQVANGLTFQDSLTTLNVKIQQPHTVKKLIVTVNGVSPFGKNGVPVSNVQGSVTLKIPLDSGYNDVKVQAIDAANQYSVPLMLEYKAKYTRPHADQKLWILSAGVSKYADTTYNLKYAAKDAGDFTEALANKQFNSRQVVVMKDREVTAERILKTLAEAKVGKYDVVMVYLAGHGLLDDKGEFYFATQDIDFNQPAKRGLSYTRLMEQLEQLPSKYKTLLLDACNSGFLDRSVYNGEQHSLPENGQLKLLNKRGITVEKDSLGLADQDIFLFMQKSFSDFSQDNNVSILSAALGNSYALENSKLQNGLFTFALIKGLGLNEAVESSGHWSSGGFVNIKGLATYLSSQVKTLSKGAQIPSFSLSKNAERVYFSERPKYLNTWSTAEEEAFNKFLERYKQ